MSHDHDEKDAKGERGLFEAHISKLIGAGYTGRNLVGFYEWDAVEHHWKTWQAARADPARIFAQAEVERLKAEVSRLKGFEKQVAALLAERRELLARQAPGEFIGYLNESVQTMRGLIRLADFGGNAENMHKAAAAYGWPALYAPPSTPRY